MSDYLVTDTELTSIADAIRTKGGTSANLSFPTEFVSAINAIQTGSQPTGTKYIYTDETDITEAFDVAGYQYCSIDYAPVRDNTLRLWVNVTSNTSVTVQLALVESNTIRIDWGDGTQGYADYDNIHTFSQGGRYCIELKATDISSNKLHFAGMNQSSSSPNETLEAVELCMVGAYSWLGMTYTNYACRNCANLKKVVVINGEKMGGEYFKNDTALESIELCEGITEFQQQLFANCTSLKTITIPSTLRTIGNNVFNGCSTLEKVHLLPTTPPTLSNTNAFSGVPSTCKIYVPSASLSAYQSASNWSAYASQMVGE